MVRYGTNVTYTPSRSQSLPAAILLLAGLPAYASLSFNATFDSSITGDATYGAAIETNINSVLAVYSLDFSNNVTVPITFGEMTTGLGESEFSFDTVSYHNYCTALKASATSANDVTADASLGSCGGTSQVNPVNSTSSVELKEANATALGLLAPGGSDGTILINTQITDGGTGPCTSGCYSFDATLEHEIDEILGLGSDLDNSGGGTGVHVPTFTPNPTPEDLFRYSANGVRSFDAGSSCNSLGSAYRLFARINSGATNLAGFNNACNGGDFGDWDSASNRVQNAFSGGGTPTLGVELTALDVIGYTLTSTTPEPSSILLTVTALGAIALLRRRKIAPR